MSNKAINNLLKFIKQTIVGDSFKWFKVGDNLWKYQYDCKSECSCCEKEQAFSVDVFSEDDKNKIDGAMLRATTRG